MSQTGSVASQDIYGPATSDRVLTVVALLFMVVLCFADSPTADNRILVLLLLAGWLPLLLRHRWPIVIFVVVLAVECAHLFLVPLINPVQFTSIPVATMVVTYTIATRFPWRTAWLYGGGAALLLLVLGTFAREGDRLAANMFALDLVVGATGAGVLIRSRHQRLAAMERRAELAERTKDEEAKRQVASERLRMARELHDVVAHNLALVNAQSSVAQYLIRSDPEAAEKALQNLTEHTLLALDELRATVGLLRQDDDRGDQDRHGAEGRDHSPVPGLPDLPALIDRHSAVQGSVGLSAVGSPSPLPVLTDLAAYRIIQEALTNARKHAPGATVQVDLVWDVDELVLKIVNGAATRPGQSAADVGSGHGLVGMRERATASHGRLTAGPLDAGGWSVEAHLPIDPRPAGLPQEMT